MRPATAATMVLAATLALAACGTKKDVVRPAGAQNIDLVLDFFPNADHAGIYEAAADGEFARAGLNVHIQTPSDPAAPLKLLAAGKADVAISYEPELLLARDKGLRLISIGALVQKPLTSIISLPPNRITSPAQLEGKRVGTAGIPYQSAYLDTIVQSAGADPGKVKEINVGFNLVPAMLTKKVDATLGAFWNYEGVQLALKHRHPAILRVDEVGVPTYDELVLVARESELRTKQKLLRSFVQAVARGHTSLRRDPAKAVDALVAANKDLDPTLQLKSVKHTLPVFFPASSSKPWGYQDPREWNAYGAWMLKNHLVKRDPLAARALTNELLPGQGV